jgi:hypothetical protein
MKNREEKQMKNILKGFIFWGLFIGLIIGAGALVNVLAEIITMKMIMTVVYIALGLGIIYILKEA